MYALARNSWKFTNRDKRIHKIQNIEFDAYAPDTMEEIINSMSLLEKWTAKAYLKSTGDNLEFYSDTDLIIKGKELLIDNAELIDSLEILGEDLENSNRKVVILKAYKAYHAYRDMLHYYSVKNLINYIECNSFDKINTDLKYPRVYNWINLGGQLVSESDLDTLRRDIGNEKLTSWIEIHSRYDELWKKYQTDKQKHAYACLNMLYNSDSISTENWLLALDKCVDLQKFVNEQVYYTRKKDYDNKFRQITFRNKEEMTAALGTIDENSFIIEVRRETEEFIQKVNELKSK